jgi:hypothetical protein
LLLTIVDFDEQHRVSAQQFGCRNFCRRFVRIFVFVVAIDDERKAIGGCSIGALNFSRLLFRQQERFFHFGFLASAKCVFTEDAALEGRPGRLFLMESSLTP